MNDSLKVSDLTFPNTLTILTSPDEVIVSVVPPQVLKVEEEEALPGEEGAEEEGEAEGESADKPESQE